MTRPTDAHPDAFCRVEVVAGPQDLYDAVTSPDGLRGWWSSQADVGTKEGDVIRFRWSGRDHTTMRIDRLQPHRRVEWTCIAQHDANLPVPDEWVGTRLVFDIEATPRGSALTARHLGLLELECGDVCARGWTHYLSSSLKPLVETGAGQPWRPEA